MIKKNWKYVYAIILYITAPYLLYLLTEKKDFHDIIAYILAPLALLLGIRWKNATKKNSFILSLCLLIVVVFVASMNPIWGMMLLLALVVMSLIQKSIIMFAFSFVGFVLGNVFQVPFWKFVLLGEINGSSVDLIKISSKGYSLGNYFMNWTFFEGRPGFGFGIGCALIIVLWVIMLERNVNSTGTVKGLLALAMVFTLLSYKLPAWDIAERVSPILLRLISKIGTPAIMFGFANALFVIPATFYIGAFCEENKNSIYKWLPHFSCILSTFAFIKFFVVRL